MTKLPADAKVELVARAIEQPFIPHGYELKPHLLKAASRAAIAALEQSDAEQGEDAELRKSWFYLHKWVERGLFCSHTDAKTALEAIAYHPSAPWHNGRWDVDHKPYARKFYEKFPKAAPQEDAALHR
jgi:hypothetical protein